MNQQEQDIKEIKKFLIGTEFEKKDCLSYRFDAIETKVCVMENQMNTLMKDREKEQEKIKNRTTFRKVVSAIFGTLLKVKTGA